MITDLKNWIKQDLSNKKFNVIIDKDLSDRFECRILTDQHQYNIAVFIEEDYSYLGCVMLNRFSVEEETYLRGRNLSDGNLSQSTWNQIANDIFDYEY
jgi:hypothetical protein